MDVEMGWGLMSTEVLQNLWLNKFTEMDQFEQFLVTGEPPCLGSANSRIQDLEVLLKDPVKFVRNRLPDGNCPTKYAITKPKSQPSTVRSVCDSLQSLTLSRSHPRHYKRTVVVHNRQHDPAYKSIGGHLSPLLVDAKYSSLISDRSSLYGSVIISQPKLESITTETLASCQEWSDDEQECHPLLDSIRSVLSQDPVFAERIISSIHELPEERRAVLLNYPTPCWPDNSEALALEASRGGTSDEGSPVSDSGGNTSSPQAGSSRNGPTQPGKSASSRAARINHRKREVPSDGDDDMNEDKPPGVPTNQNPPSKRQRAPEDLPCVMPFAHPDLPNRAFPSCRKPEGFSERYSLRKHYLSFHTQEAMQKRREKKAPVDPRFYLTDQQFGEIEATIQNADGPGKRSRDPIEKAKARKELVCNIWKIVSGDREMPEDLMSLLCVEPPSLEKQSHELFDVMLDTVAKRATTSEEDFQLSREEAKRLLTKAWEAVAKACPEISSRLLSVAPGVLKDSAESLAQSSDISPETSARGSGTTTGNNAIGPVITGASPSSHSTPTGVSPEPNGTMVRFTMSHMGREFQFLGETSFSAPINESGGSLTMTLPRVITFSDHSPPIASQSNPMPPSIPQPGVPGESGYNFDLLPWSDQPGTALMYMNDPMNDLVSDTGSMFDYEL
ncbi:hypothetical protein F4775DRAFT_548990 [Biscogniauxia sp. FL1348]|nr:hypothetical protein F4775DRAFT_548990 [Biscogniauxia sp. FL1348]